VAVASFPQKSGGGGIISAEIVSQAVPDGHTILYTHTSFSVMPSLHKTLPYDTVKSFERISLFALFPGVLLVNNNLPVKSVKELIAYAKANPGKINYAAGTTGASAHLAGALFKSMAGIDIVHVPYKGTGAQLISVTSGETQMTFATVPAALPMVKDIVHVPYKGTGAQLISVTSGETQMTFATVPAALPMVKSNRARAIAVGSVKRSGALPSIPTVAEAGLPGFDVSAWNGVMAPAGTPATIIKKLNGEMLRVAGLAEVKERAIVQGAELATTTPQEFTRHLQAEIVKWGKLVRESGLVNN